MSSNFNLETPPREELGVVWDRAAVATRWLEGVRKEAPFKALE